MGLFSRLVVTCLPVIPRPIVGLVAKRYVAGTTLDSALTTVRGLNDEGALATVDVLGESLPNLDKARQYVEEYLRLFAAIKAEGLNANVSTKPTMLGLNLDEAFCLDQYDRLCQEARQYGNWVRIDMEDHPYTDATLRIFKQMQKRHGNVGAVLQAYLYRTLADIDNLPEKCNVRLCKGIYIEPPTISWRDRQVIRENYIACLDKLLRRGHYVAIATHDDYLVQAAITLVDRYELNREQYEFQMLLGVKPELRRLLLSQGHRLRVYVPFGKDWYPYSTRRLRENPAIALYVMKAFLGLR